MNNSAVSKIISKIQFTLYSFFAFIISSIVIAYALLSYGISVPYIILPHFKAEQLYIKLDKKLLFHAKRIDVSLGNNDHKTPLLSIPKVSPLIDFARKSFQSFTIDELNLDGYKVTFSYMDHPLSPQDNSATLQSDDIQAKLLYRVYDEHMVIDLPHLKHIPSNITISGRSVMDFNEDMTYALFTLSLPECANIQLVAKENGKAMAFSAFSNEFTDLDPVVKLFELPHTISKWIVDYNEAISYQLISAQGVYAYDNPDTIVDTLFLHAREKGLNYTFHEDISAIASPSTDVYFKQGVLKIKPHHASYNKHPIDSGSVNIDFNHDHVLLDVDLKMETTLQQDIVDIVNAYSIPLPLLQEDGKTDAHLSINVDLETEEASATGQFFVKQSDLILDGVRYKVKNATARLHKSFLRIDTADVDYEGVLSSKVNGQMDLNTLTGDFYFDLEKVDIPLSQEQHLKLLSKNTQVRLNFSEKSETFVIPNTLWSLSDHNLSVTESKVSFPEKFSPIAQIDDLFIHIPDMGDLKLKGEFDLAQEHAELEVDLLDFNYTQDTFCVSSLQKKTALKVVYQNNTTQLSLLSENTFLINKEQLHVKPTDLYLHEGHVYLHDAPVSFNEDVSAEISAHYQLDSDRANVTAINTRLFSKELLFIEPRIELLYTNRDNNHYLDIKDLGIHTVINQDKSIDINIDDFSKLLPYSAMMKKYDLKAGNALLTVIGERIGMDIKVKDFHPLLSKNGKEITQYSIKGDYQNQTANLRINKKMDFLYHKKFKLTAKNIDFNLLPIIDYLQLIDDNTKTGDFELLAKSKNSNIILDKAGRTVIADSVKVQIKNNEINAQLVHGTGGVLFQSKDNNFSVFGRELNDQFMNHLFKFSTFEGGNLSLTMQGDFEHFNGLIKVDNTKIKDYTVLNNTLAFFNTIPALVTFSVPGYSSKGLKVSEMYTNFEVNKDHVTIKDTKISSKELTITAKGESDLKKENIDLLMEVKTDIGSSAKNIPLLGYIIFGDDTVSTTVRVHGDLKDPKVENSVAKSIIVAPYNIIKRTITLPFKVFDIFDDKNASR
jgi:AsmA-like C-terminal region/Protein of unknown function